MDDLPDLRSLVSPTPLVLRIGGVAYDVQPCTAETWAKIQVLRADVIASRQGAERKIILGDLWEMTLGNDIIAKMRADGIKAAEITRAAWTAFYWHLDLEDVARAVWANTPPPEPEGKAKAPTTKAIRSRRTGGATATPSRVSSSGTSSRKS